MGDSFQILVVGRSVCLQVIVISARDLRTLCSFKLSEDPTKGLFEQQGLICFKEPLGTVFLNRKLTLLEPFFLFFNVIMLFSKAFCRTHFIF